MSRAAGRDREAGVILINVLVMLALTTTVVYAMLSLAELSLARSQRFGEAGQALALLRAGEQSAAVALRRDMREAPETDHASEAWGAVAQAPVEIAGGAFSLTIEDAQDRFNINGLSTGGLQAVQAFQAIAASLGLPRETAGRIVAALDDGGPIATLEALVPRAGLALEEAAALAPYVTALPGATDVNINAASAELLEILFGNAVEARLLVSIRERRGALSPQDLQAARIVLRPGLGFRSNHFALRVTARVGDTTQAAESLLQRRPGPGGVPEVAVIRRGRTAAGSLPPPPPPVL
jgi:general secretion pathway protein K